MAAENVLCARCARVISAASAVYSNAGELLCSDCVTSAQVAELDARSAAAQRRGRIMLGVTVASIILVPSALFAAGFGQIIGQTLWVFGLALMIGPLTIRRMWKRRFGIPWLYAAYMIGSGLVAVLAGTVVMQWSAKLGSTLEDRQLPIVTAPDSHQMEEEKQQVENEPSLSLEASDYADVTTGTLNPKSDLTKLTVRNKSRFALWKIVGKVDWYNNDQPVGSMVFNLEGTIVGGESKPFSKEAGTLSSDPIQMDAAKTDVTFTRVVVKFTRAVVNDH